MVKTFNASITYDTDSQHPDIENGRGLEYDDVYHIDTDIFSGNIRSYITYDLKLVAGGGYDYKHIKNAKVVIKEV